MLLTELPQGVLREAILSFAYHSPAEHNGLVSLVCKSWRREFGGSRIHPMDALSSKDMLRFVSTICDGGNYNVTFQRSMRCLGSSCNDSVTFHEAYRVMLSLRSTAGVWLWHAREDEMLLEATKRGNYNLIRAFYEETLHPQWLRGVPLKTEVSIEFLTPTDSDYVGELLSFEVPFYVSKEFFSGRSTQTMAVFLNDAPIAVWHFRNYDSMHVLSKIHAHVEYIRHVFMGEFTSSSCLEAYVDHKRILQKLKFREAGEKNMVFLVKCAEPITNNHEERRPFILRGPVISRGYLLHKLQGLPRSVEFNNLNYPDVWM